MAEMTSVQKLFLALALHQTLSCKLKLKQPERLVLTFVKHPKASIGEVQTFYFFFDVFQHNYFALQSFEFYLNELSTLGALAQEVA